MIIVDDRLSLLSLGGHLSLTEPQEVATTWGFHYRLLRALTDESRVGALTRASSPQLRQIAAAPSGRLTVLDPRVLTVTAAAMASRHRLNLLGAELVAAATIHRAPVLLSHGNVGRSWPGVFRSEGLELRVQ